MSVRVHCTNEACDHGVLVPCLSDPNIDWLHEATGNGFCDVTGPADAVNLAGTPDRPEATPNADRLYADAIAALDPKYDLHYLSYDDQLRPEQIKVMLDLENPYESEEFTFVEQAESDSAYESAMHVINNDLFGNDSDVVDAIKDVLDDRVDDLRFTIQERGDDLITMLLKNTGNHLFRWALTGDDDPICPDNSAGEDDIVRVETMLREAGVPADFDLRAVFAESGYGGTPYLMWYGDTEDAVNLGEQVAWVTNPNGSMSPDTTTQHGTVTFTDVHFAILDHYNGSGYVSDDTLTTTVPWFAGRVSIDAPHTGPGYSWHDTAGPVASAYKGDFTRNLPETETS